MDNEDIVNYVMDNPDNTNPAVLRGMLGQLNNGGGGAKPVVIHFGRSESNTITADKTYAEVAEIFTSGAEIWLDISGWDDTSPGEFQVIKKMIYPNDGSPVYEMTIVNVTISIYLEWFVFLEDGSIQFGYIPTES